MPPSQRIKHLYGIDWKSRMTLMKSWRAEQLNFSLKGTVKKLKFFYSSFFKGIGKKDAERTNWAKSKVFLAFWLPEGVQRYVEWRSLFVAKNAFFIVFIKKTGFFGRFIPKNPFCFMGIGGLRFFYSPLFYFSALFWQSTWTISFFWYNDFESI